MSLKPISIRLEASSVCQLKCPCCPTARGDIAKSLGSGFLRFEDFKMLIDTNPWVRHIELSHRGEIFLNPELLKMIKYAYTKNVILHAGNGVNLNTASNEILSAMVEYKFGVVTCSIDGVSQEVYSIYRINGNFEKVIENIKKVNYYKMKYKSEFPYLIWQFIAFGHNEHEIQSAKQMAKDLNMWFYVKLATNNLFSPVKDKDLIKRETGFSVSSREEYIEKYGKDYSQRTCLLLWYSPQINFDGKMSGCCANYRGDFGNVFQDGLLGCFNNEKMNYTRQMLMGHKEGRNDIPCAACFVYGTMKETGNWIEKKDIIEMVRRKLEIQTRLMRRRKRGRGIFQSFSFNRK